MPAKTGSSSRADENEERTRALVIDKISAEIGRYQGEMGRGNRTIWGRVQLHFVPG